MKAITIRAVIRLLEERLGLSRTAPEPQPHDLDDLAGSWSAHEARVFDRSLAAQRVIDPKGDAHRSTP
jgi:hypothetical protein